ncbi:MAG: cobyrinate a,c-diamide synthase [Blautia sp.]|nr:cobyrinate a,c-diamide synthase [Blautia sp.]
MKIPRILLAAGASGSGKTLITCGLLQVLVNRGIKTASFKCGPDYIDPMFHSRVIGTKSRNLDTFFTSGERTRYLLGMNAKDCEIAVMEGVMGYYDGVGGTTTRASAYDLACVTDTPVILIVNSKGMSVSLGAYIKGFVEYKKDSHIRGVIFNQMSPMLYPRMKKLVEEEVGIRVLGYVPKVEDCVIESRHLGLVLPEEIPELKERLQKLSEVLEKSLDVEGILALAKEAPQLLVPDELSEEAFHWQIPCVSPESGSASCSNGGNRLRIGLAKDEAFCFFYEDNFRLLRQMGAELIPFSPIHDEKLPENLDGILLYGGYPELNAKALSNNVSMRHEIANAIKSGMPCMAECGGFMYLHEEMEGMDGEFYQMAGVIPGRVNRTPRLTRFGYITLEQEKEVLGEADFGPVPAHEFHYFDSENCGSDFHAAKPESSRGWECIHGNERMLAGFPHLYYYANPRIPQAFLKRCLDYRKERIQGET